jgi:hypothetical protein
MLNSHIIFIQMAYILCFLLKFFGNKIQYLFSCNVYMFHWYLIIYIDWNSKIADGFMLTGSLKKHLCLGKIFESYLTPGISKIN